MARPPGDGDHAHEGQAAHASAVVDAAAPVLGGGGSTRLAGLDGGPAAGEREVAAVAGELLGKMGLQQRADGGT